jgi:HSP20 family molecular chaperone IbpA
LVILNPPYQRHTRLFSRLLISSQREPLADVISTDKEVKVALEMPGVSKEDIKINAYDIIYCCPLMIGSIFFIIIES